MSRTIYLVSAICALTLAARGEGVDLRVDEHIIFYTFRASPPSYNTLLETFILARLPQHDVLVTSAAGSREPAAEAFPKRPTIVVADEADAASTDFSNFVSRLKDAVSRPRLTVLGRDPVTKTRNVSEPGHLPWDTVVNLEGLFSTVAEKARRLNPGAAAGMLRNGIPAGEAGALLTAAAIFQAWHAPAIVSAVEIDALRGAVVRSENTTVRELENGRVIAWTEDDAALPLPVDFMDPSIDLALQCSDLVTQLDRQTLRIRGMSDEQYTLTIDGQTIGVFHRDQLDNGINLALLRTPMWKQAMTLLALTREREQLRVLRRRLLGASPDEQRSENWRAAMETVERDEAELAREQRARARAGTHDYELQPVVR